jgi:multicomponent Na+:H+ antiporter subunit D
VTGAAWLGWVVLVPLSGAVLAAVAERRAATIAVGTALLSVYACGALILGVWHDGVLVHRGGGWPAPLGIELHADGVAALVLGMTAVVMLSVIIYATGYFRAPPDADRGAAADARAARFFWPLSLFLWAALNGLFLSADLFNLYVSLELLSIAAVALVALDGGTAATTAAMRYLLVSLLGSLLFLLGIGIAYGATGTLSLVELAARPPAGGAAAAFLALSTTGMALKTALFPFHGWLPPAHGAAPAPGSALLSALVVKASFFIVLRLWIDVLPSASHGAAAPILGALGSAAVLWCSLRALHQRRVKPLIAYSTAAQIGYLFLIFPLWRDAPEGALAGGVYQIVSHGLAKASLFLAAGAMVRALGDDGFDTIAGVGRRLPLAFAAFGLGGLSLAGLPPSGGFVAKWLLLTAAIGAQQWHWAAVLIAGSLLAAGYVFIVVRAAFVETGDDRPVGRIARRLEGAALALAIAAITLGVWGTEPIRILLATGAGTAAGAPP